MFGFLILYAAVCVLLIRADLRRIKLKNDAITARERITQLHHVVKQLKTELDGPNGCIAQVRGVPRGRHHKGNC